MRLHFLRLSPVARIALGLMGLLISLLMAVDLVFGLLPDRSEIARQVRQQLSESLAVQATAQLQAGDMSALQHTLLEVLERNHDLRSVAVRQGTGAVLVQVGDHPQHWHPPEDGSSTLTQVRVPVLSEGKAWGEVELVFRPVLPEYSEPVELKLCLPRTSRTRQVRRELHGRD